MKKSEFAEKVRTKTAGEVLSKLKDVVKDSDLTDCQELKLFQLVREKFDAQDQRKGTIYEKRLRDFTQNWLRGEV